MGHNNTNPNCTRECMGRISDHHSEASKFQHQPLEHYALLKLILERKIEAGQYALILQVINEDTTTDLLDNDEEYEKPNNKVINTNDIEMLGMTELTKENHLMNADIISI